MSSIYSTLRGPVEYINRKNLSCIGVGIFGFSFCWLDVPSHSALLRKLGIEGRNDPEKSLVEIEGY